MTAAQATCAQAAGSRPGIRQIMRWAAFMCSCLAAGALHAGSCANTPLLYPSCTSCDTFANLCLSPFATDDSGAGPECLTGGFAGTPGPFELEARPSCRPSQSFCAASNASEGSERMLGVDGEDRHHDGGSSDLHSRIQLQAESKAYRAVGGIAVRLLGRWRSPRCIVCKHCTPLLQCVNWAPRYRLTPESS
jgi:hypothetical protein